MDYRIVSLLMALGLMAACTTPSPAPVESAPSVATDRPSASPAPAVPLVPGAYHWSDTLASAARRFRVDLPHGAVGVTQSDDQRLRLTFLAEAMFVPSRSALASTAGLDRLAALLRESPRLEVQVLSEAEAGGRDARASLAMALDRAASTRDWLVARGVAARRIAVAGRPTTPRPVRDARTLEILIGERTSK